MKFKLLLSIISLFIFSSLARAAIEFDGTNDYILIKDLGLNSGSFCTWLNTSAINDGNENRLFSQASGLTSQAGALGVGITATGTGTLSVWDGAVWQVLTAPNAITASTWTHACVTYLGSNSTVKAYIDGVAQAPSPNSDFDFNGVDIALGGDFLLTHGNKWLGSLDDTRIYDYALTAEEVEILYRSNSKRVGGIIDYKSNKNVLDSSGNTNHGVIVGSPRSKNGYLNNNKSSLNFNGINDQVDIATDLTGPNNSYSVWFKGGTQTSGAGSVLRPFILQPETGGTGIADEISMVRNGTGDHGKIRCRVGNGIVAQSASSYNDNNWHHASCTWTASGVIFLYVDGVQVATGTAGTQISDPITSIGGDNSAGGGDRHFTGSLDEARIYNRLLNPAEVSFLFNGSGLDPGTSNLTALWTLDNVGAGLVAHYEMDDKEIGHVAAQVQDSSGNMNHGEFQNFDNLTTALSNDVPANIGTGTSLEFDGIDDVVDLSLMPGPSHPLSLSFWVKPTTNTPVGIFDSAPTITNVIRNFPAGFVEWWNSSPALSLNLTANQWAHLTLIYYYDGFRHITYYKDGVFQQTVDGPANPTLAWTSFRLGSINSGANGQYDGKLDDFRIYNKTLTNGEISYLYNGSGLDPGTSNLEALWTFDDSALKDSSGNDNHGAGVGGDSLKYTEGVLKR